jgi:uncharacterized protein Yka (UPF0111/DUF47 family)
LNHFWILDLKTHKEEIQNIEAQADQMTKEIMKKIIIIKTDI